MTPDEIHEFFAEVRQQVHAGRADRNTKHVLGPEGRRMSCWRPASPEEDWQELRRLEEAREEGAS